MKVINRKGYVIRKRPFPVKYAEHRALRTVILQPAPAMATLAAADVYLTCNPLPDHFRIPAFFYNPDEFMPGDALETHIPFYDLKVRIAYPGARDSYQRFIITRRGNRKVVPVFQIFIKIKRSHNCFHYIMLRLHVIIPHEIYRRPPYTFQIFPRNEPRHVP